MSFLGRHALHAEDERLGECLMSRYLAGDHHAENFEALNPCFILLFDINVRKNQILFSVPRYPVSTLHAFHIPSAPPVFPPTLLLMNGYS